MSSGNWHCAIDGQQQGPFTVDQLREMANRGAVQPGTLVWTDGMAEWQPISATPLYQMLASSPPPVTRAAQAQQSYPTTTSAGVGFADAVKICLSKYVDFTGRAVRSEYWYFTLFSFLASLVMVIIEGFIGMRGILSTLMNLALILPHLAVGVRRLHDTDRSGWWFLIMFVPLVGIIVLLYFFCQKGTDGRNRFG